MNLICRVEFDEHEVEAGGQLSGQVRLLEVTPSMARAQKLRLRAICRVHGPGEEPEWRTLNTAELPGPFKAQVGLPFRLPIPEQGPITYQGILLRISWHLEVQLVMPEGFSPKYETSFQVFPAQASSERRHPKAPPSPR